MDTLTQNHEHNGVDAKKLSGRSFVNAPQPTINSITDTAGATYTSTEQGMINDLKDNVNEIIVALQNLGLMR
jgi:hypothetical protein